MEIYVITATGCQVFTAIYVGWDRKKHHRGVVATVTAVVRRDGAATELKASTKLEVDYITKNYHH